MSVTVLANLETFKHMVADFLKALPTADAQAIDNDYKALSTAYLGLETYHPSDIPEAYGYYRYAGKKFTDRVLELLDV